MSRQPTSSTTGGTLNGREPPAWGSLLTLWMAIVIILNGCFWTTGIPDFHLAEAVEVGAARVERQEQIEESEEDVIREEIQTQRNTLRFWTVIAAIRDFLIAPASLGVRALAVAVALSAVAAATGRQVQFPDAMYECVWWQGAWVLGLAVRVTLMFLFQRSDVSTSILLFMPQESFTARQWTYLNQLDCFAIVGWLGMIWAAWRRGQANIIAAAIVCAGLALIEMTIFSSASLLVNLSMRMSLMPR